jgi:hypothetical protein
MAVCREGLGANTGWMRTNRENSKERGLKSAGTGAVVDSCVIQNGEGGWCQVRAVFLMDTRSHEHLDAQTADDYEALLPWNIVSKVN